MDLVVEPRPEVVGMTRRAIGDFLDGHGVPRLSVSDIQLVASELVTNALHHGLAAAIDVAVQVRPTVEVMLIVANAGPAAAIPPIERWTTPEGLATSGRGLGIVRHLCDHVEVRGDEAQAVVECRYPWQGKDPRS